jgi:hypothetical protein
MLTTIFVRSFEIQQLLSQILDFQLQLSCLDGKPLVDFGYRAEDKPANELLLRGSRDWLRFSTADWRG